MPPFPAGLIVSRRDSNGKKHKAFLRLKISLNDPELPRSPARGQGRSDPPRLMDYRGLSLRLEKQSRQ